MKLSLGALHDSRRLVELSGFLLALFGLVSALALLSYSDLDHTWFKTRPQAGPVQNWIGPFGATLAEGYLQLFGAAAFSLPLVLLLAGGARFLPPREGTRLARNGGLAALGLCVCALLDLLFRPIVFRGDVFDAGGYVGWRAASLLRAVLADVGPCCSASRPSSA